MTRLMLLMDGKRLDPPQDHSLVSEIAGHVREIAGDSHGGEPLSSVGVAEIAGFGWKFLRT